MKGILLALVTILATASTNAQELTQPIRYTWIATSCEDWHCATSAFMLSAGDSNTIVLPTIHEERPWLILRRVEEGSVFIPEDEPFACEVFEETLDAMSRYDKLIPCHAPTILSVPGGQTVVLSLQKCGPLRRRAAAH